jgi:uncharacterized protein YkwD
MDPRRTPRLVAFAVTLALTLLMSASPAHAVVRHLARPGAAPAHLSPRAVRNRTELLRMLNRARASHHAPALRLNKDMSSIAWHHSWRMMRAGTLFHTENLTACILNHTDATSWGEDIAVGPTISSVDGAWMNSPPHRSNILNGGFHRIGIGIVLSGGRYWMTIDLWG